MVSPLPQSSLWSHDLAGLDLIVVPAEQNSDDDVSVEALIESLLLVLVIIGAV